MLQTPPHTSDAPRAVRLDRIVTLGTGFLFCLFALTVCAFFETGNPEQSSEIPLVQQAEIAVAPVAAQQDSPMAETPPAPEALPQTQPQALPEPEPQVCLLEGKVQSGQTFTVLAKDFFSSAEIYHLAKECESIFSLSRLAAGHAYAITTKDGGFQDFEYEINADEKLSITKTADGFEVTRVPIEYDIVMERIDGRVDSSLYAAVAATGETPELAVRLADIFAWDVDFVREIRGGDTFSVLVEKRSREGEFAGYGRILAAEFVNQGTAHRGYLFEAVDGRPDYYDKDGRSLRKAFLKAPLDFRRISSSFSNRRLHPVLKIYRPHHGIDYAAPVGTPVKAAGDGTVIKALRDRNAGRYVKIRHANGYESTYMHLSRFGRSIRRGVKVRQGQVIGYVGSSGLSTGPHLDFRMKKDGRYINPAALKCPPAAGVPKERMTDFLGVAEQLRVQLTEGRVMEAQGQPGEPGPVTPDSVTPASVTPARGAASPGNVASTDNGIQPL